MNGLLDYILNPPSLKRPSGLRCYWHVSGTCITCDVCCSHVARHPLASVVHSAALVMAIVGILYVRHSFVLRLWMLAYCSQVGSKVNDYYRGNLFLSAY